MLRWAILGTSFISGVLAQAIDEVDNCELIAVGSRHLDTAKTFSEKYKIKKYYLSYDEVLADENVDIVYIGLPNHLHKEWTIKSAKAGKHILCEKPFTVTAQEAQETINVIRENNVFFMEAQMYRCHPQILKLIELIQSNIIGKVMSFNAVFSDKISHCANLTAGGSIMDLGCYPVSLARLLIGAALHVGIAEPITVQGLSQIDNKKNYDQQSSLILKFDKNIIANILVSNEYGPESFCRIYGDKGYLEIENPWLIQKNNTISIKNYHDSSQVIVSVQSDLSLYAAEVNTVNNCVIHGKYEASLPAMTWDDSVMNMHVLDQWRKEVGLKYEIEYK